MKQPQHFQFRAEGKVGIAPAGAKSLSIGHASS